MPPPTTTPHLLIVPIPQCRGGVTPPLRHYHQASKIMGTKYNPNIHHRRSIRLPGYDYSQIGAYFVTICVLNRECLLGIIKEGRLILSPYGEIVDHWWQNIPTHFDNAEIDASVIMPNHFHGIIVIPPGRGAVSAPNIPTPTNHAVSAPKPNIPAVEGGETPPLRELPTLGKIVAYFKYKTTKAINQLRNTPGQKVWQRNYYEHIIRNEISLARLRHYIQNNPQQWVVDQLHPQNLSCW
jgi:putative transposase